MISCYHNTRKRYNSDEACLKHILENQVYGLAPTPILQGVTQTYIFGFDGNNNISRNNFIQHDITPEAKAGTAKEKLHELFKLQNDMKFDAVVGNPPYQDKGGAGGTSDASIYQNFCELASEVSSHYVSLIIPSRWFAGGRENLVGEFRNKMLTSCQIQELTVFTNSKELFDNVEIKGGVCYYLENKGHHGACKYTIHRDGTTQSISLKLNRFDVLIREPIMSAIVEKVESIRIKNNLSSVDSMISSNTPFGIPTNPKASKKTPFKVYSSKSPNHDTLLFHIENNKRKIEYVSKLDVEKNAVDIIKAKVFIPDGYGAGESFPHQILGNPEYGPKNSVCSQSYLYVAFDEQEEAKNFLQYIKTKFFRGLVSSVKITQSAPSRVYKFVPLEKLDVNSAIDWFQPIANIDQQLYKKYGLSYEEIDFIERMIKPMD